MNNPICTEMKWPVPPRGQTLSLSLGERRLGYLIPEDSDQQRFEGVYNGFGGVGVTDSCFSIVSSLATRAQIRHGLAQKLRIGVARLDEVSACINPKSGG